MRSAAGLVEGQLSQCQVLVGQALLPVREGYGDLVPDRQECLSYPANQPIAAGFAAGGNECGKIWNRECRHPLMSASMISLAPGQNRVEVRKIPI